MLTLQKREPQLLTLIPASGEDPAVKVRFAPISRGMRRRAQRAMLEAADLGTLRKMLGDGDALDAASFAQRIMAMTGEELDSLDDASEASSRALIRLAILDHSDPYWEGIGDADGNPLPVTAETVEMALDDDRFFEAADRLFVQPSAARDREKNGSPASPSGTGEAGMPANGTASSAAKPKRKGAAKNASTPRTSSGPRRAKASGKS